MKTKKLLSTVIFTLTIHAVIFAQWSSSVNLSPNSISAGQNESMGSCIGVSGNTVHVIWSDQRSSTRAAIYYTRSLDAGLTWSNPVAITDTNRNAWNPAIAVNGSSVHVVWRNIVNNIRSSYYKHSLDGGNTWEAAVLLDSAVADWPAVTVSGNYVYVANDIVTSTIPYNTEIFFIRSTDNGATWSTHQQITSATGRSEDEAITAQGADVFMSWNDNRNTTMQIWYKHSGDFGVTWDPDVLINSEPSYGTMVSVNGTNIDIPSSGAPSGLYQIHLNQSANTGASWGPNLNVTNDAANTYYYPYMVRDGADLHMTYYKSNTGGQYIHSADGGATWSTPYSFGNAGITPFCAVTGCVAHIVWSNSGHIYYARNPTGNAGHCGQTITTGSISGSPFCPEATVSVPFTSVAIFNSGNIYTAQLSDRKGNFATPVTIGSLSSTANSGTIAATVPSNPQAGTKYRIRVTSSNPVVTGTNNGANLQLIACNKVTALFASGISATEATINWTGVSCAAKYKVQYRKQGTTHWTEVYATTNSYTITGLVANSTYQYRIQTFCSLSGSSQSGFTPVQTFTTTLRLGSGSFPIEEMMSMYPNPATSEVMLVINAAIDHSGTVKVFNAMGQVMKECTISLTEGSNQLSLNISSFPAGIYFVEVQNEEVQVIQKLVKE
ncbi:MAG TPA: T9SS type A sorting domain-containing protein [Chitinophagales bacterium]|nr:T9SS type A sorting domain-containing protein [Chitinophagales bacterium]